MYMRRVSDAAVLRRVQRDYRGLGFVSARVIEWERRGV